MHLFKDELADFFDLFDDGIKTWVNVSLQRLQLHTAVLITTHHADMHANVQKYCLQNEL